jgi:hypothetical protein
MVTFFMSIRVLQAEQLTDDNLLAFGLCGGKSYEAKGSVAASNTTDFKWITNTMWSDIYYLSSVAPFSKTLLSEHITKNPGAWNHLKDVDYIMFDDLPIHKELSIDSYPALEIHDVIE